MNTTEGAAYGAALLAAVGAGWYPSVDDACASLVESVPAAAPGTDAERYAEALRADTASSIPRWRRRSGPIERPLRRSDLELFELLRD